MFFHSFETALGQYPKTCWTYHGAPAHSVISRACRTKHNIPEETITAEQAIGYEKGGSVFHLPGSKGKALNSFQVLKEFRPICVTSLRRKPQGIWTGLG